ncbi:MAG: hypothetical protein OXC93_15190 [Rhodospirillaceae bacterium]|nr:hypothetical protein [Rhodospirillaceae bacterium]
MADLLPPAGLSLAELSPVGVARIIDEFPIGRAGEPSRHPPALLHPLPRRRPAAISIPVLFSMEGGGLAVIGAAVRVSGGGRPTAVHPHQQNGDGIMTAAMAMPGNTAATFLVHLFGSGLADDKYVIERFKAHADGDMGHCTAREAEDFFAKMGGMVA